MMVLDVVSERVSGLADDITVLTLVAGVLDMSGLHVSGDLRLAVPLSRTIQALPQPLPVPVRDLDHFGSNQVIQF